MGDIFHRAWTMVTDGARFIDWVIVAVDFLVLIAILWFEYPEWAHKRKLRKIVPRLIPYMDEGREVEEAIQAFDLRLPKGQEAAYDWTIKADEWGRKTGEFLALHSAKASAAFLLVINSTGADRHVYSPKYGPQYISGRTADCYQTLLSRLDNLRRIIEKPEAYF